MTGHHYTWGQNTAANLTSTIPCVAVQDQASSKVDSALREPGSELHHLAQLLTGQRLAAAVSLASASGDIRLAMLLCQVLPQLALATFDAMQGFGQHVCHINVRN